ncbi:acyltransferase family protein [Devosia sp. SL43]|uniref:acyltransferase family protein n=1 Tax=Devosia sp. SL43 TaxID=2806348 RepID=UPI001F1618B1|nr:acyltransferase [Devosia sp. SL43]UJW85877.1 acyltransferase [Devosia sp. SL43]
MTEKTHFFAESGILRVLQAGRAIAACAVVIHHAAATAQLWTTSVPGWISELSQRSVGFNFFFVLSGFIILYSHGADKIGAKQAGSYFLKRFTRIFAPYLPVAVTMMLIYTIFPQISMSNKDWGVVSTLTLIPTGQVSAVAVAWTLQHEIIFYVLFGLFYFVRPFALVVLAWGAAILGFWITGIWSAIGIPLLTVALHPLNLMFIAGMLSAVIVKRVSSQWWPVPLLVGVAGLTTFVLAGNSLEAQVGFGVAMAPFTTALIMLERGRKIIVPNILVSLGGASYSIYLVHLSIVSVVARLLGGTNSWLAIFICSIAFSIVFGVIYHHLVEKRFVRFFNDRRRAAAVTSD